MKINLPIDCDTHVKHENVCGMRISVGLVVEQAATGD